MSDTDSNDRINELEAQVEMLKSTLKECMTAFQDAMGVLFAETNEHAKCHAQQDGLSKEEVADKISQLINLEAHYLQQAFGGGASPHEIIHNAAEWLGHTPLPSQVMGGGDIGIEVGAFAVKPGQSIEDVLKEQLDNEALPTEMRDAMRAMLDSGTIDQADAQLRDLRNQNNSHLN